MELRNEEIIRLDRSFEPRPYQRAIFDAIENKGFQRAVLCWARRSGKDCTLWHLILRQALKRVGTYMYCLPTYSQAKSVIWQSIRIDGVRFIDMIPKELIYKLNESTMSIELINHSIIKLIGSDSYNTSLRGSNPLGIVFSEYAQADPDAFKASLAIVQANQGWIVVQSTPWGHNGFYDLVEIAKNNPKEWFYQHLTIADTGHITRQQVENDIAMGLISREFSNQEYYCFPGDQEVLTSTGVKAISDIKADDLVIAHSGRPRKVLNTLVRPYKGELIELYTYGNPEPIRCTPEHPIRIYDKETQKYSWKNASEVTLDDRLVFPKMVLSKEKFISYELCMLIAWYICEGSGSKNAVQFSLGKPEEVERVVQLLNKANYIGHTRKVRTGYTLYVYSVTLLDFMRTHCGTHSLNKRIPFELIKGHEGDFFDELMKGDGCYSVFEGYKKFSFTTVSKNLAFQVQILANSLDRAYTAGLSIKEPRTDIIEGREVECHKSYQVNIPVAKKYRDSGPLIRAKYGVCASIKSINKVEYSGNVYNLNVQHDASYIVGGRAVHNCDFNLGVEGSYYAKYLVKMRLNNQIGNIPYESHYPVNTCWDIGVDDMNVIIYYQVCGNVIHIIDYYEDNKKGLEHYCKEVLSKDYTYNVHVAPHDIKVTEYGSGVTRHDLAARMGIHFEVCDQHLIMDGIEAVRCNLGRIYIDETKCKRLLSCLENYSQEFDPKLKIYKSKPRHDQYSHGCFVPETKIAMGKGELQIKDVKPGMFVKTPFGVRKVLDVHTYMTDELVEVKTRCGGFITTVYHDIFTQRGLVKSNTLRYTDNLEYIGLFRRYIWQKIYGFYTEILDLKGFKKTFLSLKMNDKSCLMDIYIDGMETIIDLARAKTDTRHCNVLYGNIIRALYLIKAISITLMVTLKTIALKTWRCLAAMITLPSTCYQRTVGRSHKDAKTTLGLSMLKQQNGTEAQKVSNGIKNMLTNLCHQLWARDINSFAMSAEKTLLESKHGKYIALSIVKTSIERYQEKTLKIAIVVYARVYSLVTNTLLKRHVVKSVHKSQLIEQKLVYDLTIEHDNCYYANGYLVSNSDCLRYLCSSLDKVTIGTTAKELDERYRKAMMGNTPNFGPFTQRQ